ncbi:MAG: hypothetical protein WAW37_00885 [Syntrophobacteraceae bacterium]
MEFHFRQAFVVKAIGTMILVAALLGFCGRALAGQPYKLVYFDGHMHTVESDGSGTMEDVKEAALQRGLSAVIVTNHTKQITLAEWRDMSQRAKNLSEDDFLMLNAFEVTGSEGLFNRDHVLAWGVDDPFVGKNLRELAPEEVWQSPPNDETMPNPGTGAVHPENIAKWVDYIHANGGIAVHAHTTGSTNPVYGVDYIEVFNLSHVKDVASYAAQMGLSPEQAWGLGLTMNNMAVYGERDLDMEVELFGTTMALRDAVFQASLALTGIGQYLGGPEAPLRSWDDLLMAYVRGEMDRPVFGAANSDAHNTFNLDGRIFVNRPGDNSDVGEARNGILVQKLTRRHLLDAIKAGRSFATTGPSLSFTVNGKNMGETMKFRTYATLQPSIKLSVNSESPVAVLAQIDIIRNGKLWKRFNPMTGKYATQITDTAPVNGYYRVEVTAVNMETGAYSFAYANPVFIKGLPL